jgi:hypothetical protein
MIAERKVSSSTRPIYTRELTADEDIGSPVSGSCLGEGGAAADTGEFDGRRRLHAAGASTPEYMDGRAGPAVTDG